MCGVPLNASQLIGVSAGVDVPDDEGLECGLASSEALSLIERAPI